MSRQIQIRRGSATEHEDFTGAIGEITMDTTNKTLRVHDGETAGGTPLAKQSDLDTADYVVEYQNPTAENNYSWYRKYKSGWVEQGGKVSFGNLAENAASVSSVNFLITMTDTNYNVQVTPFSENSFTRLMGNFGPKRKTGFDIGIRNVLSTVNQAASCWVVQGYAE